MDGCSRFGGVACDGPGCALFHVSIVCPVTQVDDCSCFGGVACYGPGCALFHVRIVC